MTNSGLTHFVGIGGAGMSSLAAILLDMGEHVSGCDQAPNPGTQLLQGRGAAIFAGHGEAHLEGVDRLVVTGPAAQVPEVSRARTLGITVLRRAELLGQMMDERRGVAVAGTHGKTTSTALLASMLVESGVAPTAVIGGVPSGRTFGGWHGSGEWLVAEADEYDRSFLHLHPEIIVLTSIDMDHPDIYADIEDVQRTFATFLGGARRGAKAFVCVGSERAMDVARAVSAVTGLNVETYGRSEGADWRTVTLRQAEGHTELEVYHRDARRLSNLRVCLAGYHNMDNVTGAIAAAFAAGATEAGIRTALERFRGVARRFEQKGCAAGVTIIDDYSHHPAEVEAALHTAREIYAGRQIWVAFQPHTYSRTRELMPEFASALRLADRAYVLDVYAAREAPDPQVSGERLTGMVGGSAVYAGSVQDATARIDGDLEPGVLLLTMGAGDVTALGPRILEALERRERP